MVAVAVVVVAAVAAVVVIGPGRDGDSSAPSSRPTIGRAGSEIVDGSGAVDIARSLASYRITYRVEQLEVDGVSTTTDTVTVRRPWESRLETAPETSVQIGAFGRRLTLGSDGAPSLLELPPAIPPSDVRIAGVLEAALDAGLVTRREVRRVAGRLCQVVRSAGLVNAAVYRPPAARDYGDSCVDDAGLVLEEVLVVNGSAGYRRIATAVEENVTVEEPATFAVDGTPLDVRTGGGSTRRLKDGSAPPGEVLVLPAAALPAGFVHQGRYSVVPPQPENFAPDDPTREAFRRAGIVDVWVNGVDVLLLDQGGTLRAEAPFVVDEASPKADLGSFGQGEVRIGGLGAEVRVLLDAGRYLRVAGTIPPDQLAAVARSLVRTEGNTLEFA